MADGGLGVPEDCFVPGRNARDSDSRRTGGRAPALAMRDRLWSEREVGRRCSSRCWLGRCGPAEVEVAQDALDDLGRRDECDESAAPAARTVENTRPSHASVRWVPASVEDSMKQLCPRQHAASCGVRQMVAPGALHGRWLRGLDGLVGWVGDDLATHGGGGSEYPVVRQQMCTRPWDQRGEPCQKGERIEQDVSLAARVLALNIIIRKPKRTKPCNSLHFANK